MDGPGSLSKMDFPAKKPSLCGTVEMVMEILEINCILLREPIHKPHGAWLEAPSYLHPSEGILGEMKGFANQKPNVSYNRYIKEL